MIRYKLLPPHAVRTTIELPASKSISNRALIINALSRSLSPITNLSDCDDTQVMIKALNSEEETVDVMAAGTAMRFLTAYLSVTPGRRVLTGTARMQQRPIQILVDALRELGADIEYLSNEGYPPLRITGTRLSGNEVSLPANVSSQYISALLMIGPTLPDGLRLHLYNEVASHPYLDMTMQLMRDFGAVVDWTGTSTITAFPKPYRKRPFAVESDWSAASYWYEIAILAPEADILLPRLNKDSYQGDSRGTKFYDLLGTATCFDQQGARLTKQEGCPKLINADLQDMPDLAQTLVVTCVLQNVRFRFAGLQSLRIKETDRIAALQNELRKLGYVLQAEGDDALSWDGTRCDPDPQPVIETYEDHRMAMAFAPAAFRFPGLRIAHPEVVSKSYPRYWEDLRKAGFRIEEEEV